MSDFGRIGLKDYLFHHLSQRRDRHSSWRTALRQMRGRSDAIGVRLLKALYRVLVPFRSGSLALVPYATFSGDGFATQHNVDFLKAKQFASAFERSFDGVPEFMTSETYRKIIWRAHICSWGADHALNLKGDFVELGVWWGLLPKTICELFMNDPRFSNRPYYLVDSWGKMPGSHPNPNYQADIYHEVQARFDPYPNVKLVKGLVPEILPEVTPPPNQPGNTNSRQIQDQRGVAFLTIDMNGHIAERAALEYYYDLLVPGAFVYFDDYGWGYEGLVETVNDFLKDKPEKLLHFPSGQSIFLKV